MACYFSFLILSNRCYYLNFTSISNMYFVDEGKDIELPRAYMDVLTYSLHHEEIQEPHYTAGRQFLLIFSLSKFTCDLIIHDIFFFGFYFILTIEILILNILATCKLHKGLIFSSLFTRLWFLYILVL